MGGGPKVFKGWIPLISKKVTFSNLSVFYPLPPILSSKAGPPSPILCPPAAHHWCIPQSTLHTIVRPAASKHIIPGSRATHCRPTICRRGKGRGGSREEEPWKRGCAVWKEHGEREQCRVREDLTSGGGQWKKGKRGTREREKSQTLRWGKQLCRRKERIRWQYWTEPRGQGTRGPIGLHGERQMKGRAPPPVNGHGSSASTPLDGGNLQCPALSGLRPTVWGTSFTFIHIYMAL